MKANVSVPLALMVSIVPLNKKPLVLITVVVNLLYTTNVGHVVSVVVSVSLDIVVILVRLNCLVHQIALRMVSVTMASVNVCLAMEEMIVVPLSQLMMLLKGHCLLITQHLSPIRLPQPIPLLPSLLLS